MLAKVAIDYFLKVPGIPGESVKAKHKDEIDVIGFSFGARTSLAAITDLEDLVVLAPTSKASPLLWLACVSAKRLDTVVLTGRRTEGKSRVDFFKITLTGVMIASYEAEGGDDEPSLDQVAFRYHKIELAYTPVDANGMPQSPIRADWHRNRIPGDFE